MRANTPRPDRQPPTPKYREEVVEVLGRLMLGWTEVRLGKMFGFPAYYCGRSLFACVYGDGLGLKLPENTAARLKRLPGIEPFRPYGKPEMREWVWIRRRDAGTYERDAGFLREAAVYATASPKNRSRGTGK